MDDRNIVTELERICAINLDSNILEEITKESGCFIANYNSLQQTVLSGNITSILL